jgi:hypothetical protein
LLRVAPTLAGDFAELSGDHFRFSGGALGSYTFSKDFTLGGGILWTWQFGRPLPVPGILLDWQILDELRFRGLFPSQAALIWRPHNRFEVGLSLSVRGQLYALTSNQVKGNWPCQAASADDPNTAAANEAAADPARCFSSLSYARGEIGPTVSVRLVSSLWLSVHAGFTFFRRYQFLNDDGEVPDIGDLTLDRNLIVQARLALRIPGS